MLVFCFLNVWLFSRARDAKKTEEANDETAIIIASWKSLFFSKKYRKKQEERRNCPEIYSLFLIMLLVFCFMVCLPPTRQFFYAEKFDLFG